MRTHLWEYLPTRSGWIEYRPWLVRVWLTVALTLAMAIMVVETVTAQNVTPSGVRVSISSDSPELTVGDVVILSLVISHPVDLVVVVPRLEREWGPFEVQDQTSVQTISADEGIRTVAKQFRVTLFGTGNFETPAFPITVRSPDGSVEIIEPAPVKLTVNSVLSGSNDQLKDLRPPADSYDSFWDRPAILVITGIILISVLGSTGYYLFSRSRRQKTHAAIPLDAKNPWEVAEQEFDRIVHLDLPGSGNLKGHYTLVADALRVYMRATFLSSDDISDTAEMSTREIAAAVRQSTMDAVNSRAIIQLMEEADLVKFANYSPSYSRAHEFASQARNLVETTRLLFQQQAPIPPSEGGVRTT